MSPAGMPLTIDLRFIERRGPADRLELAGVVPSADTAPPARR
jgi:hypothetical protein